MRFLRFFFWLAALAAVVVGILRLTVLRWWQVPIDDPILEASITPSLSGGDWVLLWRATAPAFGSLVVCPDPEEAGRVIIGRLVGEQGDTIAIDGAKVSVNERDMRTESRCNDETFHLAEPSTGKQVQQHCDMEATGAVVHMRGTLQELARQPLPVSRQVSEGKVFLVSDNRAYPFDSRHYGSVDRARCKETIFFRLVSRNGFPDEKARFSYIR
jgi:signal peptidase I